MYDINHQFDTLVLKDPKNTIASFEILKEQMAIRDCKFGDDLISTFLKPLFLNGKTISDISTIVHHVIRILEKVAKLYFSHPELREYFYINGKAKELIDIDHGYSRQVVIARPDSFLVDNVLKFVEFNCDSPAGAGYTDVQENILSTLYPFTHFNDNYVLNYSKRVKILLDALLGAYTEFAGKNKTPNIAIVDWHHVRTQNEFRIIKTIFEKSGYDTVIADPRELRLVEGKLTYKGFSIDLIYRRVIFKELINKFDEVSDFIDAYKKGKVCVVNPFRSRLASNKAILSLITNQKEFKSFFTNEENHIINHHIPWTRRVIDMETSHEGNTVFVLKHIKAHRTSLVLKPADSYGGKDVFIGQETDQATWEKLVDRIVFNCEDWVVQRYVDIPQMEVPLIEKDTIVMRPKKYNINPFVFGGQYAGSVVRLSEQSVINVSAGGGLVPVIEYNHK